MSQIAGRHLQLRRSRRQHSMAGQRYRARLLPSAARSVLLADVSFNMRGTKSSEVVYSLAKATPFHLPTYEITKGSSDVKLAENIVNDNFVSR